MILIHVHDHSALAFRTKIKELKRFKQLRQALTKGIIDNRLRLSTTPLPTT